MVSSSRSLSLFLSSIFLLLIITQLALAQPPFLYNFCINDKGNYTTNSSYHENLNTLLTSLPSANGNGYGFYNSSHVSQDSPNDQVYAIGLCRGDVNVSACRSCLNDSTHALTQLCPNRKEAIGWYDNCMLRYSNRSIYGVVETGPAFYLWNPQNVTSSGVDGFNQELRTLLEGLRTEAAAAGSLRKFAIGNRSAATFQTIYALVQCTPDLSELQCSDCLDGAFGEIPSCCDGKTGGRVVRPSCNFRYEVNRFIDPTTVKPLPSPPLPPPSISPPASSNTNTTISGGPKPPTPSLFSLEKLPVAVMTDW